MHGFLFDGMEKIQTIGVKGLPLHGRESLGVIEAIPQKGVADGGHMNSDLVGTAGFQLQLQVGNIPLICQGTKMCDCRVPLQGIDAALNDRPGLSADGKGDGPLRGCLPLHQGPIGAMDLPPGHLSRQEGGTKGMTSQQEQPGGIPIQTVDAAVDEGLSPALKVVCQTVGQGIGIIARGGMDGGVGWLVHYQQVLVFIDDGKGKGHRLNMGGRFLLGKADLQPVTGGQGLVGEAGLAVVQDSRLCSL